MTIAAGSWHCVYGKLLASLCGLWDVSFQSAEAVVPQSGDASRHSSLTKSNDLSPIELARRRNAGQLGPTHQQPEGQHSSSQEQSWAGRPVPVRVRRRTGGKRGRTPASADRYQPRKPAKHRRQGRKGRALQAPRQLVDPLETYAHQISLRARCNAASAALLTGKSSEMRALHVQAPLEQLRQIQPPQTRPSAHAASAQAVRPAQYAAAASRLQAELQPALLHPTAPAMTQHQAPLAATAPHQKASPDPKHEVQPRLDHTRSRSSSDLDQAVQASDHDTCSMDPAAQHTIPRRTQQAVSAIRTRAANAGLSTRARSLMGLASPHGAPDMVRLIDWLPPFVEQQLLKGLFCQQAPCCSLLRLLKSGNDVAVHQGMMNFIMSADTIPCM